MGKRFDRFVARAELQANGEIVYDNPRWVKGMLQQYDPAKIMVVFERRQKGKSKEQLGYLWGVVYPEISNHTGHSPEELHEIFKVKFLRKKKLWRGTQIVVVGSTEKLRVGEMAEFISNVILEAGELGIAIPDPDKLYQFKD